MKASSFFAAAVWLAFASAAAIKELPTQAAESAEPIQRLSKRSVAHFPEPKYFKESRRYPHYDARFSKGFLLTETAQLDAIRVLVQTYLSTFRDLGIQTWLMHGTLLGWWWGKEVMPWDLDADVQVMEADMYFLAAYHNMTIYYYKYGDMKEGRFFQLEINPYFKHREQDDVLNVIDARWIDLQTGLYIDITAARYDPDHKEGKGVLYDKHGHEYRDTYLFPLRDTTFEGVPAKIPYRYKEMLEAEYGRKALTRTKYNNHEFDEKIMKWVSNDNNEL
ncbi:mannosylphosphorylation protein [Dactylonectria estremocensis]|uniref:Mannosylphosphorylation protein n=1 Tax=Dactylonectria estremocensis TaxID=1079267 RepID=A0A9P9F9G1_9HYPO|nr:mannosylphosphorylation protein [Dactylonectria estremocensis]